MAEIKRLKQAGAILAQSFNSISDLRKRGTLDGTPRQVNSPHGKAIEFADTDSWDSEDYIDVIDGTSDMTVGARVKCNTNESGTHYLFSFGGNGTLGQMFLNQIGSTLSLYFGTAGSIGTGIGNFFPMNEWKDIVVTRSGSYVELFVNGVSTFDSNSATDLSTTKMTFKVGRSNGNTTAIKDAFVFDRVLSDQEIQDFTNGTLFDYENSIVAEWDFSG